MTVEAISTDQARARRRKAALLAWIWPEPLDRAERGPAPTAGLLAWLWPSALEDATHSRRHGLMALLFGWAWPSKIDGGLKRFWRTSWLWSWMWPGRVMGPDGEVCALAPWHPAARAVNRAPAAASMGLLATPRAQAAKAQAARFPTTKAQAIRAAGAARAATLARLAATRRAAA